MSTPARAPAASSSSGSPLDAFTGTIEPTRTGPLYHAGLLIVTVAMVLLPLIYIGLIGLTAWGVIWHLSHDFWILEGGSGRGGLGRLLIYLAPAVAGAILVFFMVKPFFASRAAVPEVISLDPAAEPLLFSFVERICRLVGAPVPGRIDVDCEVNASASLRRGILSRELVLTIGLPLATGLSLREFAGVLAHEFGHFAQGAGMRLTYVVRWINHWFARVVYERDAWDVKLEEAAKGTDLRIGIVLHAARGCVWLTRRVLWVLMQLGHAISCFMLRQMEYDADSYEAKLAGSDAFETTARRLRELNLATQVAYEDVKQSWASHRLPENLLLLIDHKAAHLPAELRKKVLESGETARTRWFDTHPCDADRVRAVKALNEPGVFRVGEPATVLFADFAALSRRVTRHQYEKGFRLEFTDANLMSADEILRESAASAEADAMVRSFYGEVNISLQPLFLEGALPAVAWDDASASAEARARWKAARERSEALRTAAESESKAVIEPLQKRVGLTAAHWLAKAGFQLEPKAVGLPGTATSPGEQEAASLMAIDQLTGTITTHVSRLDPFIAALRERVTLALSWSVAPAPAGAGEAAEVSQWVRLMAEVGADVQVAHGMATRLRALTVLAENIANHSDPAAAHRVLDELAGELRRETDGLQARLASHPYPFPHARGALTVAEYARSEKKAENEIHRTFLESDSHIDQLFALHYRLMGRLLAVAARAEQALLAGDAAGSAGVAGAASANTQANP